MRTVLMIATLLLALLISAQPVAAEHYTRTVTVPVVDPFKVMDTLKRGDRISLWLHGIDPFKGMDTLMRGDYRVSMWLIQRGEGAIPLLKNLPIIDADNTAKTVTVQICTTDKRRLDMAKDLGDLLIDRSDGGWLRYPPSPCG